MGHGFCVVWSRVFQEVWVTKVLPSNKKESGGEPLSGALTVLCKEHFGLAFQVGGKPLLHFFGCRLGFALDHSVDDFLHHVGRNIPEVILRKTV